MAKAKVSPLLKKAREAQKKLVKRQGSSASVFLTEERQEQAKELARQIKIRCRVDAIKLEISAVEKIKKALSDVAKKKHLPRAGFSYYQRVSWRVFHRVHTNRKSNKTKPKH